VGITGANFLVAETGQHVLVTNEGNGDLTSNLPRVQIIIVGIEKVVPTLEDASCLLRLLSRSATGQHFSNYSSLMSGPARQEDMDGPEQFHVVLVDNHRTDMLAGELREMLRCFRCGACLNHCPVYGSVGGHAYGWVYPGPMGSVVTPAMIGIENAPDLPHACTLNGRCAEVCPMSIPLPKLLREHRRQTFLKNLQSPASRYGLSLWAAFFGTAWREERALSLATARRRVDKGAGSTLSSGPFNLYAAVQGVWSCQAIGQSIKRGGLMSARERVLGNIARALNRGEENTPTSLADRPEQVSIRLSTRHRHTLPASGQELMQSLIDSMESVLMSVVRLQSIDDCVSAVDWYLESEGIDVSADGAVTVAPALESLSWPSHYASGAATGTEKVSVTPCLAAVAETGSIVTARPIAHCRYRTNP